MTVSTKKDHQLVELFLSTQANLDKSGLLIELKSAAKSSLDETGFPTLKEEEYKFTNINKRILDKIKKYASPNTVNNIGDVLEANQLFNSLEGYKLIRNNGVFEAELSSKSDGSFIVKPFSDLNSDEVKEIGSIETINKDPFTALNSYSFESGIRVEIPEGAILEQPILLVDVISADANGECVHPRAYFHAGKNSQATVIEITIFLDESPVFLNEVQEWNIESNAHIRHYKLQDGHKAELGVSNTSSNLARDATFTSVLLSLNGEMLRNNLSININDTNCTGNMYGIYMLNGKTHVDNHTNVDHKMPHSESNELYKGILTDQSRGVFNGKIFVRKDAQKTNAFQQNNNILLSEEAILNTKPQLEIWADDVKCSHGCTTGQLDEEALFYLRARGIGKESAKSLLLYAFAGEVLDKITHETFKKYCEEIVHERLGAIK
ncbi:Fe-S cluster assembly protein SufD [Cyclobacterium qasimii]|uniref:Iron-sulfur cluster assembly protein SufD n=2 Tax=Cyclobacterium qasimii TaxID=1350429 RepID=S7VBL4_9BACT|nr:Fe-S cluster assembly protein SufD [Cyclobacterium qasimii]EPR66962.1 Iron-sulfur cluster assembly protein SufD [Cyclobacterium qasimii M12-11B]GEO20214.1 Fe-S cluster assembly protein SufD [Cyclobacterium qasimii]